MPATEPGTTAGGRAAALAPHVIAAFRAVTGLLFACHGAASIFGILGGAHGGGTLPAGQWPGWWAALIQLGCGALVFLGLAARPAALLASGSMAYAYFTVHVEHSLWPILNGGEPAALYSWAFLLIAVLGPGSLAVDRVFARARRTAGGGAAGDGVAGGGPAGRGTAGGAGGGMDSRRRATLAP